MLHFAEENLSTHEQIKLVKNIQNDLNSKRKYLKFSNEIEIWFSKHLIESQKTCLITSGIVGIAILNLFLVIDLIRFSDSFSTNSRNIVLGVRLIAIAILTYVIMSYDPKQKRKSIFKVVGTIFVVDMAISISTNIYHNLGIPSAESARLVMVIVAFSPLGIRFFESLFLALTMFVTDFLLGILILESQHWESHFILMGMMAVAILISAIGSYRREKSIRDQFLLRHILEWRANHDELTGLNNRYKLTENSRHYIPKAKKDGLPISFAIIDIDYFKAYNDYYGHQLGDEAIRKVGELLQNYSRNHLDMVVRLGGEEFAILTFNETAQSLSSRLADFQNDLKEIAIEHKKSQTSDFLTVSIGLTQLSEEVADMTTLYKKSDEALYFSKNSGRNRITHF